MAEVERHQYDVVVIGAGGAGLRAVIEARERGLKVAVVTKSLFGKAHTVMAEGGCAAAMGNANPKDNWQVHFGDTMRGGKFLNNWRMAELHAKEAPDRVWELETYGALFDRTKDGRISQRNFGGHTYPRLAHVGDRTGLEIIRTLQQKIVSLQQEDKAELGDYEARIKVFHECTITDLIKDGDRIAGAFGYWRETGNFILFEAPAVVLATGGIGKSYKVTSNSWEYTGDGHALALRAGATLINMEFIQFHPTGMVWPPSVKGILVTEGVRGDGGVLKNSEGKRFMFDYIPPVFKGQYAETIEEADQWLKDNDSARRTPDLLPRDEVARAINSEVKAGRDTPHGGVYLDIASRMPAEEIKRRLPSMYHQFIELAEVDITKEAMEVGPTCHYVMGGIEVDPDTGGAPRRRDCSRRVSAPAACTAPTGWAATRCPTCWCSAAAPGSAPPTTCARCRDRPAVSEEAVDEAAKLALAPFEGPTNGDTAENPYTLHADLQESMNDLVGIIRKADEVDRGAGQARRAAGALQERHVEGAPAVQPGLAPGHRPAQHAAGQRVRGQGGAGAHREPRRPHPRRPPVDGLELAQDAAGVPHRRRRTAVVPDVSVTRAGTDPDAARICWTLFELSELEKYFTDENWPSTRNGGADMALPGEACGSGAATTTAASCRTTPSRSTRARWCSTSSTGCRQTQTPDLAVRWNCKAGKCGSCSAEINGRPRLLCMTRMSTFDEDETDHGHAAADVPGDPRPGHRRVVQLREGPGDPVVHAAEGSAARRVPDAAGGREPLARSSASASSASCARTPATWCVTTRRTSRRSPARGT